MTTNISKSIRQGGTPITQVGETNKNKSNTDHQNNYTIPPAVLYRPPIFGTYLLWPVYECAVLIDSRLPTRNFYHDSGLSIFFCN